MRSRAAVAVAILLISSVAAAQSHRRGAVDWIFLIDTSKSMRGAGGTQNIFPDVKASIHTFVGGAQNGDSISIYTFDRDARFWGRMIIQSNFDRDEVNKIVDQLAAEGNRTHLGLAIQKGLERAADLKKHNDATRERSIVLFTDGQEDVRGIPSPVDIPSNIQRVQDSRPWIFFVSMGAEHEQGIDVFARHPSVRHRTRVLRAQDAEEIKEATNEIRQSIEETVVAEEPPQAPPEPARLQLSPPLFDFGEIGGDESTEARKLTITSDQPVRVAIELTQASGVTLDAPATVSVASGAPATVDLRLKIAEDAPPGRKQLSLSVVAAPGESRPVSAGYAPATVVVKAPSVWLAVLRWAGAILLLLALLLVFLCLRRGQMPGELVRSFTRKDDLEGEIEIIKPARAEPFVGLPALETQEIALSALAPEGLTNSDARLYARRRAGVKEIWIAREAGSLRINDIEVPESALYDSDLIEIDDTRLRFNWSGHERPSADPLSEQEEP